MNAPANDYRGYADLAKVQVEDTDYRVYVYPNPNSTVAVIAPHGGGIEQHTSDIARAIAGDEFNLYLFEGIRRSGNYATLHLTSHRFDEPRCVDMLSSCDHVVAIHGCRGEAQQALVGGLDTKLKAQVAESISAAGVEVLVANPPFPATEPRNICNRGRRGVGVQIEMTMPLRSQGPRDALVNAVRSVLFTLKK